MFSRGQKLPTDQDATQSQECFMDVSALLVADAQSAKLVEPGKGSLHDPSPTTEPTFDVALRESAAPNNHPRIFCGVAPRASSVDWFEIYVSVFSRLIRLPMCVFLYF